LQQAIAIGLMMSWVGRQKCPSIGIYVNRHHHWRRCCYKNQRY